MVLLILRRLLARMTRMLRFSLSVGWGLFHLDDGGCGGHRADLAIQSELIAIDWSSSRRCRGVLCIYTRPSKG